MTFDAGTNGGSATATTLTYSHTVTGSNPILLVGTLGSATGDRISGVTYNGVAMTLIDTDQDRAGARWNGLWLLMNPATGAHNVVVTSSPSDYMESISVSYTGCAITGQPDTHHKATQGSGSTLAETSTSVANNCWHIAYAQNESGNISVGSGTTSRVTNTGPYMMFIDNNGAITPAGNNTLNINVGNSSFGSSIQGVTIAPFVTTNINPYYPNHLRPRIFRPGIAR